MTHRTVLTVIAIVESRADRASSHICRHLRELTEWERRVDDTRLNADGGGTYYVTEGAELRSFDDLHLHLESPVDAFSEDPELLVFASRHSGNTGPLLTAHCTGNVGPAEFGGADYAVAEAAPNALSALLEAFDRYVPDGYDTGLECTHHGPTDVGCPSLFAELGSDDEQWDDPAGARAVANAILDLRGVPAHGSQQVVGFGGNHYVPRFERIVRETPWAVGHVAADWALEAMGDPADHPGVFEVLFEASETSYAVIDGDWPEIETLLEGRGYSIVSETWLRAVGDRPLDLVESIETRLGPIDDGVRFGDIEADAFSVVSLPSELFAAAELVDSQAVWDAVADHAVAFETRNGGSRIGDRAALPGDDPDAADGTPRSHLERIVRAICTLLEREYERVTMTEETVTLEQRVFDPELARAAGVPEGPAFGQLADGDDVTIDGTLVESSAVHRTETTTVSW
ncbi:hypothetical protein OB919_01835 [Halobacteria archaeon AArc-curdl1]|uniref:D-aminoacyl-tRNA deacylase n=1 Tax=Natronosalvus hydrolyticus TaxID=2979988 RepID=A0AAP3E5U5_9EURY|nr:hypothetical protein [Halobacteria archaeon AArc-curdl1]